MRLCVGSWKAAVIATLVLAFSLGIGFAIDAQERGDVQALLDEGLSLYKQGDYDGAREKFEKAILLDPSSEAALEWVEKNGLHQVIKIISEDRGAGAAMSYIMKLTQTEYKKRETDKAAIDALLDTYFSSDDVVEYTTKMYEGISTHGVYLIPGLFQRIGSAEEKLRVRAILAFKKLSDDAVIPLCRGLQHSDPTVVGSVCAALGHIGNPEAIPSLQRVAQTANDQVVREIATKNLKELGASADGNAYDLLISQARRFYGNPNHMHRAYHDPIIWTLGDDGSLGYEEVHGWAVNELNAEQLLNDAIALNASGPQGRIMQVCNLVARSTEYRRIRNLFDEKVARGDDVDEELIGKLKADEATMARVEATAYGASNDELLGAIDVALNDRRFEIADAILKNLHVKARPGHRAESVSPVISRAITCEDRGVRFAAAELLAAMNPASSFDGADRVIPELADGLIIAGTRIALTNFPDEDDALRLHGALKKANTVSVNEKSAIDGLSRAREFPPEDVILLSSNPAGLTAAEMITALRKDYRTKGIPILVVASSGELTKAKGLYEDESRKVWVIDREIEGIRLREDVLEKIWEGDQSARARGNDIAARAATALGRLAAGGPTIFSVHDATKPLSDVLANRDDGVRAPALKALRSLNDPAAVPRVVELLQEGQDNDVNIRVAAYQTLGSLLEGSGQISPEIQQVLEAGEQDSDANIIRAVFDARGQMAAPRASIKD